MKFVLIICFLALNGIFGKNLLSNQIPNQEQVKIEANYEIIELNITDSKIYIINMLNQSYLYCLSSDTKDVFYGKKDKDYFVLLNDMFFEYGDSIYVNPFGEPHDRINIKITPYKIHTELNAIETTKESQYFILKTEEDSIAYFDSFDRNSYFYLSNEFIKTIIPKDKRIDGQLKTIKSGDICIIKNKLYSNDVFSSIKIYFSPIKKSNEKIIINVNDINFLYLEKINNLYTLNIQNNTIKKNDKTLL